MKMLAFFSKKTRKGQQWMTSETIIFFFAAILLIGLVAYFIKLQSALFADEDDGSKANLIRLNEEIKELLGTDDKPPYRIINYFIGEQKMLLVFDKDANGDYTKIAASSDAPSLTAGPIYKPFDCGNSACLCLYNGVPSHDIGKRDQGVLRCEREGTGKSIFFSGSNIFKIGNLEDMNRRTQQIYIEKIFDSSTNFYHIYINEIDTSNNADISNIRKKAIDNGWGWFLTNNYLQRAIGENEFDTKPGTKLAYCDESTDCVFSSGISCANEGPTASEDWICSNNQWDKCDSDDKCDNDGIDGIIYFCNGQKWTTSVPGGC